MRTISGLAAGLRVGVDTVADLRRVNLTYGVRAAGERLPFASRTFDVICCQSVLEHVQDPGALFSEIARCLAPGGVFVFLTPNRWDYVSVAARLIPNAWHPWIVRTLTGRDESDTFPTFYRANDVRTLRHLASEARLSFTQLERMRQHPHYLASHALLYAIGIALEATQRCVPIWRPWLFGMATPLPEAGTRD